MVTVPTSQRRQGRLRMTALVFPAKDGGRLAAGDRWGGGHTSMRGILAPSLFVRALISPAILSLAKSR